MVCQTDGKALMSNPNKALGKWILRDVLEIPYNTIVTYDMLLERNIDAISFKKLPDGTYKLDFEEIGTLDRFIESN